MNDIQNTMTRDEMKVLFKRHKGSMTRVAKSLGLTTHCAVSLWFSGRVVSRRIEKAVHKMAQRLIEKEEKNHAVTV